MSSTLLLERPHRRLNALTGEWVFVSPQRLLRPWRGELELPANASRLTYDPDCYLCPRNVRANGQHNPDYTSTHVFDNDFPAFLEATDSAASESSIAVSDPGAIGPSALLVGRNQRGVCRVVCYSPRHDLTLADMSESEIGGVIKLWIAQATELEEQWVWVQIFENKGEQMGCSNPHPHGQIWASDFLPSEVARELKCQDQWFAQHRSPLLLDYAWLEQSQAERVIVQNEHWLAVIPWWAAWPYETLILPRRAVSRLTELSDAEQAFLAQLLSRLLQAYDRLFATPFPYSLGWHGAPVLSAAINGLDGRQLHGHIYSSLLRSAEVKKFMVGYEMLAEAQRDLTPEQAAQKLRSAADAAPVA